MLIEHQPGHGRYALCVDVVIAVLDDELLVVRAPVIFGTLLSVSVSSTRADVVLEDVTLCVTGLTARLVVVAAGVAVTREVVAGVEAVAGIPGVILGEIDEIAPNNPEETAT